jgi:hypothetical protein
VATAPDPDRVHELAERLIRHRAAAHTVEAADTLGACSDIAENEHLDDDGWCALMTAVDEAATTAQVSVTFPSPS